MQTTSKPFKGKNGSKIEITKEEILGMSHGGMGMTKNLSNRLGQPRDCFLFN